MEFKTARMQEYKPAHIQGDLLKVPDQLTKLANKETPFLTPKMFRGVSEHRQQKLIAEKNAGMFQDGNPAFKPSGTHLGVVSKGLTKSANLSSSSSGSGSGNWRGSGGTVFQPGETYSPLWVYSNLSLPRDRATINAWSRAFVALNAFVANSIFLHSTYPISRLNIKCKDKTIEKFFADMSEELDLMNICIQIAQEYWTLGEAFPYAEMGNDGKWTKIILQNPDYMIVKQSMAGDPILALRPDENLKRICTSNNPIDLQQRQNIHPFILEHVRRGENIPLSNFNISHIARRISPYDIRGTGLIVPAFKPLMLFDLYRESKYVQASNFVNPWTIVKIGSDSFKPEPVDIEAYKDAFLSAESDRNFRIFTHNDVTVEKVGASGGILDISNDITALIKEIYIALMVPSALMDGGADTTYANAGVALDVLRQRYTTFRNILTAWLRRNIFAPVAQANDMYDRKDGKKTLIVPEIEWNHMSLFDAGDYINQLLQFKQAAPENISLQTIYRSLGLDYQDEVRRLREEAINEVILAKEKGSMNKMSLHELKALGPDDEVREVPDTPVPGEVSEESEAELPGTGGGAPLPGAPPPPPGAPPAP